MSVPSAKRCLFEQQEDVMFYLILEMPNGKDNAFCLPCCPTPSLTKAASEGGFLLCWLELCQEQGVSNADLLGIEPLDH